LEATWLGWKGDLKSKVDKAWVDVFQKANEERIEAIEKMAENAFQKTDEVLAKHIEQDRENFIALFTKVESNKDLVNIKQSRLLRR